MSCCVGSTSSTKKTGDLASSVINKVLRNAKTCAVQDAVRRANTNPACAGCAPLTYSGRGGVNSSQITDASINTRTALLPSDITAIVSQGLKGVPESVRIRLLQDKTAEAYSPATDLYRRFSEYKGKVILPPCPPTPTEILNSTMPKYSKSCALDGVPGYLRPSS
jgi:hypothetical protein